MKRRNKQMLIATAVMAAGFAFQIPGDVHASQPAPAVQQKESRIKGKIIDHYVNEMRIKGEDGKIYKIGLHAFPEDVVESMRLPKGATVIVTGERLESEADFYTFEYYKRNLPPGISDTDMKELKNVYEAARQSEKKEDWEAVERLWLRIQEILEPYEIAAWEPEPFEEYIRNYEYTFRDDDYDSMKRYYDEWIALAKAGKKEEAEEKSSALQELLYFYYLENYTYDSFDEFLHQAKITLKKKDYPVIKKLYEESHAATKAGDEERAMKKWEAFYKLMEPYYRAAYVPPTFDEYIGNFEFKVKDADLKKLRKIYATILKLQKQGKYEEEDKQWQHFNKILDPYFKEYAGIPFRALSVRIGDKVYK